MIRFAAPGETIDLLMKIVTLFVRSCARLHHDMSMRVELTRFVKFGLVFQRLRESLLSLKAKELSYFRDRQIADTNAFGRTSRISSSEPLEIEEAFFVMFV